MVEEYRPSWGLEPGVVLAHVVRGTSDSRSLERTRPTTWCRKATFFFAGFVWRGAQRLCEATRIGTKFFDDFLWDASFVPQILKVLGQRVASEKHSSICLPCRHLALFGARPRAKSARIAVADKN